MIRDSREDFPLPGGRESASPGDELFCIHSYAGEAGPPCGWRGRRMEATRNGKVAALRGPRCGRATLMEIPRE